MDGWLLTSSDDSSLRLGNLSLSIYISSFLGSKVVDVVVSWEDIDDDDDDEYDDGDDDDDGNKYVDGDNDEYDDRPADFVVCCW